MNGGQNMIEGMLIAESMRVGAELDGVRLVVRKIRRSPQGEVLLGSRTCGRLSNLRLTRAVPVF